VSEGKTRYEVEHIWAEHPERHTDEFEHAADFAEYRNRIGGLLLLPKKFNASYGDLTYEEKLPHYLEQNLLALSLHPQCYEHNPGFLRFKELSGLPFVPLTQFKKADVESRSQLYTKIAERIWNPDDLLLEKMIDGLKPYPDAFKTCLTDIDHRATKVSGAKVISTHVIAEVLLHGS
jgi:hypothetical protein